MLRNVFRVVVSIVTVLGVFVAASRVVRAANEVYLPLVMKTGCSATGASYQGGQAFQWDSDNPVRPTYNHPDKNLAMRSYSAAPGSGLLNFVNYGSDDPNQPPQFATLFSPNRVPNFTAAYRVNNWNYAPSPDPGTPGGPITNYPVTALGLQTSACETIYVPTSAYDIGGGMEVLVLFADSDSVTLKYTREDSVARNGYTVHVDGLVTDPTLLALYNSLDTGARYVACGGNLCSSYNLVNMPAGHPLGKAAGSQIVIAIADTGSFQDPRSCNEWWQIRPSSPYSCS
ncbi:MAG: hypothetical protein ACT4QE_08370 [Anaerolineales bacterium]